MRAFASKMVAAACGVLIVMAAGASPVMAKGLKIHIHIKKIEHSVSRTVHRATRSVSRAARPATRSVTRTVRKAERGTRKAVSSVRRTTNRVARTAEKGAVHVANKVGKPVVRAVERTEKTVVHAVEHPKETIEALEKTTVDLSRYARMDISDITHGNIRKLMRDTANQQSAINRGIARDTGVSVGVLKVIQDMEGAALLKAAARVAENPRAALDQLKKDARSIASAARTIAADIKSGNGAKLLRDLTREQNAVFSAGLRTEVELSGLPASKSMLKAGLEYQETMNKMLTGQGAAELIEAIVHGKTNTALLIATRDANTLQGTGLTNAANSEIRKATGISTAVLNTAEQIASLFVGGGQEAVVQDTAKFVAEKSVRVASEDAVKAGVKAATEDAARQVTQTGTREATRTVEREATETATRQATRDATREATQEATQQTTRQTTREVTRETAENGARVGTREVTSPGAREAVEVIPQGIVRDRVRYFESLSRPGVRTAVEDGARTGTRTAVEEGARTGTRTAVEEATRTGAETAVNEAVRTAEKTVTEEAVKGAGKGGFDDMVKSRLTAVAEDAAKEAMRNGFTPLQVEQFARGAVRKAGAELATESGNYARYAMLAAKGKGSLQVWQAVAADAATQTVLKGARKAGEEYMERWAATDGAHIEELAMRTRASRLMYDPIWVGSSLTYLAATSPTGIKAGLRLGEIAIDNNQN